jgi:hypothetical protein
MHRDIFYCRSCCLDVWMKTSVQKFNSVFRLSLSRVSFSLYILKFVQWYNTITYGFVFLQTFYFLIICFVGVFYFLALLLYTSSSLLTGFLPIQSTIFLSVWCFPPVIPLISIPMVHDVAVARLLVHQLLLLISLLDFLLDN